MLFRSAASLGVGRLIFTVTDTGERSYREANLWKGGEFREYLINGLQTAGGTVLPAVELCGGLREALAAAESAPGAAAAQARTTRLVLDNVGSGRPLSQVNLTGADDAPGGLSAGPRAAVLAVGSERGWSERERRLFREAGFESVSLGSRVLRTETACSIGAALALARMGFV